ncbi:MAG: cysteine hydrolase family protein [Thermoplasmata archaeon]|jgi:nicotinamidase-related amidase|nr:cysteine hydrolase [Thermoplasmatales archaeon]
MIALIIVDMIHEFVDGKFGSKRAVSMVDNLNRLISIGREKGWLIVFARDSHSEGDPELKVWGPHAMKGSFSSEIVPGIQLRPEDIVIEKNSYDAFFKTDLERILSEKNVDKVIVAGVSTDICVLHTVCHAFFLGYETYVVEECTESMKESNKEFGLKYMKTIYGTKIISLERAGEIG